MRWYVLQTTVGEEENLVEMIQRMVPENRYGECFVVYHEQLWRRKQKNFVHVKRAFPGYVFITSNEPEALFFCLKKLPAMAKLMADEESFFLSLDPEEAAFLEQITDEHHVIRLSYLETDGKGTIGQVSEPLKTCVSQIVRCKFGKRYVIVRMKLLGREKDMLLGIVLNEDIRQEVQYGKVEAPIHVPKTYQMVQTVREEKAAAKKISRQENPEHLSGRNEERGICAGDRIEVIEGAFKGMSAMVYQVKDKTVKLGIRLFGRTMEVELPLEMVRKWERDKE